MWSGTEAPVCQREFAFVRVCVCVCACVCVCVCVCVCMSECSRALRHASVLMSRLNSGNKGSFKHVTRHSIAFSLEISQDSC